MSKKNEKFLSRTFVSKTEFAREYKQLYSDKEKAKDLYLTITKLLEKSIQVGNVTDLKRYANIVELIHENEDLSNLSEYYKNPENVLKNTNLVILASKFNQDKIVNYLFEDGKDLLKSLAEVSAPLKPNTKDDRNHNVFYYAMRSGNNKLLKALSTKWPDDYFGDKLEELDDIISSTYEELKLKNVPLTEQIEIFIERKILNLRFFSNNESQNNKSRGLKKDSTDSRINLVIENINCLSNEYDQKVVDNIFLFKATFIAQNIHILKQNLKFTYGKIPWEEMEFILISFISSHLKKQEMNLFYKSVLNKSKVFCYLKKFAELLQWEKDEMKFSTNKFDITKANRQLIVKSITKRCPDLKVFYKDFQQLKDIYSLEKINEYIKLALSSNPKTREGQLIIIRVMQVIGEYLKNTPESPNLSETTSNMFLLPLQKDVREIIIDLRNSLSHSYSLSKRTELEQNRDEGFFEGVQNDAKIIITEVSQILYKERLKLMKNFFEKAQKIKNFDELSEVVDIVKNFKVDKKSIQDDLNSNGKTKLQQLMKLLVDSSAIVGKETNIVTKVEKIIFHTEKQRRFIIESYLDALESLKNLRRLIKSQEDKNQPLEMSIKEIQATCTSTLSDLDNVDKEDEIMKELKQEITDLLDLCHSGPMIIREGILGRVVQEVIFHVNLYNSGDAKNIEELREKLQGKESPILRVDSVDYSHQLELKLNELKTILKNNSLGHSIEKLQLYKSNKRLQAVVEMLVLDIMSILSSSKHYLENNLFFLDDNSPLLTGKSLRNHLAHDNILLDVLLFDPSVSVILNAKKLTEEAILKNTRKIGKPVFFDSQKLKEKYEQGLILISNQNSLFTAAEKGNLRDFENLLRTGADIYAKDPNSWTTLHFAAKSPNLELVKFIISHKVNGEGPNLLHIAAAHGRTQIIEFFINEQKMNVDDLDKKMRTPLHFAAQNGHVDTVKSLLQRNAKKFLKDKCGDTPAFLAIKRGHVEVVKVLLEGDSNMNLALHESVRSGYMDIITYLIEQGAQVDNKCDLNRTPLHVAALCGNFEAAKFLIDKGASIDLEDAGGSTPLLYAVQTKSNDLVELLIEKGARINHRDKKNFAAPIHMATSKGSAQVVETLLKNKADPNLCNGIGQAPLAFAVVTEQVETVEVLLKNGADPNVKDSDNQTLLSYAIMVKNVKIVKLLIKYKVDVNNEENFTPLHKACKYGCRDIIEFLVENGAKVNVADHKGHTPLMIAAAECEVNVVDRLIRNNAVINQKSKENRTALHFAALKGQLQNVELLLSKGAVIDGKDDDGSTALQIAAKSGFLEVVESLVKNGARIDETDVIGHTALHSAIICGYVKIVDFLITKGADVASFKGDDSLLVYAMRHNDPKMIETLISHGADVGSSKMTAGGPMCYAVMCGYTKIVKILLKKNKSLAKSFYPGKGTILHGAAQMNHADIVQVLIDNGADVNATANDDNYTAICMAVLNNAEAAVEVLIKNGAKLNGKFSLMGLPNFTLLHIAALKGYANIVRILLNNKANVNAKSFDNDTPLELALFCDQVPVVKEFVKSMKFNVNDRICKEGKWTILHVAVSSDDYDNLNMVKFIVNELGADIDAEALQIAAKIGQLNIVKFLISQGQDVNQALHSTAIAGRVKIGEFLIHKGADLNAEDENGNTPINLAAREGHEDFVKLLLENGASYPVTNMTQWTSRLFEAVNNNNALEVKRCLKNGGVVNAKHPSNMTPLHQACLKGYTEIVRILLRDEKCDLNIRGAEGLTPLQFAAKFNNYEIVKMLLEYGAMCNETAHLATERNTVYLLNLLSKSFKNIEDNNTRVIDDLSKLKDKGLWKAILRACNERNETLVVAAERNKFSMMDQLKDVVYAESKLDMHFLQMSALKREYSLVLTILNKTLDMRKDLLGPDHVGTLDVLLLIGKTHLDQGNYLKAKRILENCYDKRNKILGSNHADTLKTRSHIALVLHRLGKYDESTRISREVYEKQKKTLGHQHEDTFDTYFNIAMSLQHQQERDKKMESLSIYQDCLEMLGAKRGIPSTGPIDSRIISAKNNVALIKSDLGSFEEASEVFQEVYELKKSFYGVNDPSTLGTLVNMAMVFANQKDYPKTEKMLKQALSAQKAALGLKHPETLRTQMNMATILTRDGKLLGAYKLYKEILNPVKEVFGFNHRYVSQIIQGMDSIESNVSIQDRLSCGDVVEGLQKELTRAVEVGDYKTVEKLLTDGVAVNDANNDGRTALHFAVSNGHPKIVDLLIKSGSDVTLKTKKGNTTLHLAALVRNKEIVDLLIEHVDRTKALSDFVNVQTIAGGTSALHEAARNGSFDIVTTLLTNGAIFDLKNKKNKTPADLCEKKNCKALFELINDIFEGVKKNDRNVNAKIEKLDKDTFLVVSNVRNVDNKSLLQIAMLNKRKDIVELLLRKLKQYT